MNTAHKMTAIGVLAGAAAGASLVGYPSPAIIFALLAVAAVLSVLRDVLNKEDRS